VELSPECVQGKSLLGSNTETSESLVLDLEFASYGVVSKSRIA
jgi:hypothetical protein